MTIRKTTDKGLGTSCKARFDPHQKAAILQVLDRWKSEANLNWTQLARQCGIDPSVLSAARGRYRSISIDTATKIAQGLGKEVGQFYYEVSETAYKLATAEVLSCHGAITSADEYRCTYQSLLAEAEGQEFVQITSDMPISYRDLSFDYDGAYIEAAKKGADIHFVFPKLTCEREQGEPPTNERETHEQAALSILRMRAGYIQTQYETWHSNLHNIAQDSSFNEHFHLLPVNADGSSSLQFFSPGVTSILVGTRSDVRAWSEFDYQTKRMPGRCLVEMSSSVARHLQSWFNALKQNEEQA